MRKILLTKINITNILRYQEADNDNRGFNQ